MLVTHGYIDQLVRWLREHDQDARPLKTLYRGEGAAEEAEEELES